MVDKINFSNSYSKISKDLCHKQIPDSINNPKIVTINKKLLQELELSNLSSTDILDIFSGSKIVPKSNPVSLIYAGHQFGHFVPQLGDGRAVLLGQLPNKNNTQFDIQLKGSGKTKFSRQGDGKYPLASAIKEYIISEALFYLKIPTTRSLCLIATNEAVFRESVESGAVLTRVAKSHIRFGTFEYFAFRNDLENIKNLTNFCIKNYYPKCQEQENQTLSFFKEVYKKQIDLVTSWMSCGFIHGVMNTDNCLVTGESIDFGPCAFMETFKKDQTFSYIDRHGRYSYQNQKPIILWNLICFAKTILPLINQDIKKSVGEIENIINNFETDFDKAYYSKMLKKIGLKTDNQENRKLVDEFLETLEKNKLDFANSFRKLSLNLKNSNDQFITKLRNQIKKQSSIEDSIKLMNKHNPIYIPRNHLIKKVIDEAIQNDDNKPLEELLKIIKNPFKEQKISNTYKTPPNQDEEVKYTFCGT